MAAWPGESVEVRPGTDVVDPAGEQVGRLVALHPEGEPTTHLVVQTGVLFVKGYFVPIEAVASIGEDRIALAVPKDRVEEQGWDAVPDESV